MKIIMLARNVPGVL